MILQRSNFRDRRSTTISQFLKEAHRYPVLSNADLLLLLEAAQSGDIEARHKICDSNYRLLVQEALSCYKSSNYPISDLIQEGFIGLNNAITHFDFSQKVPFYAYSKCAIKRAIILFLRREGSCVKTPINIEPQLQEIREACSSFSQREERDPDVEELKDLVEVSKDLLETYYNLEYVDYNNLSLENIPSDTEDNEAVESDKILKIRGVLGLLSEQDREFISKFFGIGRTKVPISTLSREMGKSVEWVRLHKVGILKQLKVLLS